MANIINVLDFCPYCEKEHILSIKEINSKEKIKDRKIKCKTVVFYCKENKKYFENGFLADINLQRIKEKINNKEGK